MRRHQRLVIMVAMYQCILLGWQEIIIRLRPLSMKI